MWPGSCIQRINLGKQHIAHEGCENAQGVGCVRDGNLRSCTRGGNFVKWSTGSHFCFLYFF